MTVEQRTIVHENALVFVQEVEKAIHSGLRITDTIAGFPVLNTYLKEVFMVPAERAQPGPAEKIKFTTEDSGIVLIESYDNMILMLTVQEAVLAGFSVHSVDFMPHGIKLVELRKPEKATGQGVTPVAPVLDEALVTPAPAKTGRARTKTK